MEIHYLVFLSLLIGFTAPKRTAQDAYFSPSSCITHVHLTLSSKFSAICKVSIVGSLTGSHRQLVTGTLSMSARYLTTSRGGESWFLSTFVADQQPPESEQLGTNKPDGHAQGSHFTALGSIATAPVDHRPIISINTDDEKFLENVLDFAEKLRNHAGNYWIKDFDLHGNSRAYAFSEPLAANRTPTSSGNFTIDTVEWPEPWHECAVRHGPCKSCPPKVKAPWRRVVYRRRQNFVA
jgi:hypothetical protein